MTLKGIGLNIGSVIVKGESEIFCDGSSIEISEILSRKILVRVGGQ